MCFIFISILELAGKLLHMIKLDGGIYAVVNEVLQQYTNEHLTMLSVKRHLFNKDISLKDISLDNIDIEFNEVLEQ